MAIDWCANVLKPHIHQIVYPELYDQSGPSGLDHVRAVLTRVRHPPPFRCPPPPSELLPDPFYFFLDSQMFRVCRRPTSRRIHVDEQFTLK